MVVGKLVSTCKSTFITNRNMLYEVLVVNEVLDYAKRFEKSCMMVKLDFEKAHDCVSWNFLRYLLRRMGFGDKWINVMEALIFNSPMSILANGSLTKDFWVSRRFYQGNPLSPFLFLLVVEGLVGMVNMASSVGDLKGVQIIDLAYIDILQFSDDTILIGDESWDNL